MESLPDVGPLPGRHQHERQCLREALAHYVVITAFPRDPGLERERLCEALARDWIPIQDDLNGESDKAGNRDAELWMNLNLDRFEVDSPDSEPAHPADGK